MKKVIVVVLIMFSVLNAHAQDLIKEIQKLTLENDSLQKQVIKPLNDSIVKLTSSHRDQIVKLNEQLKSLEKDKGELNKKNEDIGSSLSELNRSKIKLERDSLKFKCDSLINKLKDAQENISKQKKLVDEERELFNQKASQEKDNGKSEIRNQIIQTYTKPLDELIINSTIKSVERDMSIVGDKTVVQQKLLSLQIYFNAQQVLNEKFSEQRVTYALNQLKSLEQTALVLKLNDKLVKYKLVCYDGLKTTIDKIIEIDKKFVANDDFTQKEKLKDVMGEIAWFIRNYKFDLMEYPYLSSIVLEVIKLKEKDANSDVSFLKDKL